MSNSSLCYFIRLVHVTVFRNPMLLYLTSTSSHTKHILHWWALASILTTRNNNRTTNLYNLRSLAFSSLKYTLRSLIAGPSANFNFFEEQPDRLPWWVHSFIFPPPPPKNTEFCISLDLRVPSVEKCLWVFSPNCNCCLNFPHVYFLCEHVCMFAEPCHSTCVCVCGGGLRPT